MPSSATATQASPPFLPAVTRIWPPFAVYLMALSRMLEKIWTRRTKSPSTTSGWSPSSTASSRSVQAAVQPSTARRTASATSTASTCSVIMFRVIRETSSRSSTRRTMCVTCRSRTRQAAFTLLGSCAERLSASTLEAIGANGLRSSCARIARNSSFRRSASRRASSERLRSSRTSLMTYCRRRLSIAARSALIRVTLGTGRCRKLTLPRASSRRSCHERCGRRSAARVSTTIGMTDQGGSGGIQASHSCKPLGGNASSAMRRVAAPPSRAAETCCRVAQIVQDRPAAVRARAARSASRPVGVRIRMRSPCSGWPLTSIASSPLTTSGRWPGPLCRARPRAARRNR